MGLFSSRSDRLIVNVDSAHFFLGKTLSSRYVVNNMGWHEDEYFYGSTGARVVTGEKYSHGSPLCHVCNLKSFGMLHRLLALPPLVQYVS